MRHQQEADPASLAPWQHLEAERQFGMDGQLGEMQASPETGDNQEGISMSNLQQMHHP